MKNIKIMYWFDKREHKRVFMPFTDVDGIKQSIVIPKSISSEGLKISNIYKYNHSVYKQLWRTVQRHRPDILVQCGTSHYLRGKIKKNGIKHVFINHGLWSKGPNNIQRVKNEFWGGFDLVCGVTAEFKPELDGVDIPSCTDTCTQIDVLYECMKKSISTRNDILRNSTKPGAEKIIVLFGHKCTNRKSVSTFNEGYYRTSINLARLAEKHNWLLLIKPKNNKDNKFIQTSNEDWAKELRRPFSLLYNSEHVRFISPIDLAYNYLCAADVVVTTARSTIEIEAAVAQKPSVRIWTPTTEVDDYITSFEHGLLEFGAEYVVYSQEDLEDIIINSLYGDNSLLKSKQRAFSKRLNITFDGKAHKRALDAMCNIVGV